MPCRDVGEELRTNKIFFRSDCTAAECPWPLSVNCFQNIDIAWEHSESGVTLSVVAERESKTQETSVCLTCVKISVLDCFPLVGFISFSSPCLPSFLPLSVRLSVRPSIPRLLPPCLVLPCLLLFPMTQPHSVVQVDLQLPCSYILAYSPPLRVCRSD